MQNTLSYSEFLDRLRRWRPIVRQLVSAVERAGSIEASAALCEAAGLVLPQRVHAAFYGNTIKLRGVRRIDGPPYASHPAMVGLFTLWILPADDRARDESAVTAILHDYLEEGDGLSAAALCSMRAQFPEEGVACLGAALLTEPALPYHEMNEQQADAATWRDLAYVVQAEDACERLGGRALGAASLADKLDNLHDLGYIRDNPKLSPERRRTRLLNKLAYFLFVARRLGRFAEPLFQSLLECGVSAQSDALAIPGGEIEGRAAELERLRGEFAPTLLPSIRAQQELLGLF